MSLDFVWKGFHWKVRGSPRRFGVSGGNRLHCLSRGGGDSYLLARVGLSFSTHGTLSLCGKPPACRGGRGASGGGRWGCGPWGPRPPDTPRALGLPPHVGRKAELGRRDAGGKEDGGGRGVWPLLAQGGRVLKGRLFESGCNSGYWRLDPLGVRTVWGSQEEMRYFSRGGTVSSRGERAAGGTLACGARKSRESSGGEGLPWMPCSCAGGYFRMCAPVWGFRRKPSALPVQRWWA